MVNELVVIVHAPATVGILIGPSRFALIAILRVVALNELVEILGFQRIGLESKMLVGSEIVDPELLCPRCLACRFLVEEKDISFDTLSVEQTSRKTQKGVDFALVQQLTADGLACAPSKTTLSGTTIAARPFCFSRVLTC